MDNIIVYIGTGFSAEQNQKIAEMLRIRQIATTNDIHCATVVIKPQTKGKNMTLEELAMMLIKETEAKIDDLHDIIKKHEIATMPETIQKQRTKSYMQINKKYKQIKQIYKQKIFNRTKHK